MTTQRRWAVFVPVFREAAEAVELAVVQKVVQHSWRDSVPDGWEPIGDDQPDRIEPIPRDQIGRLASIPQYIEIVLDGGQVWYAVGSVRER